MGVRLGIASTGIPKPSDRVTGYLHITPTGKEERHTPTMAESATARRPNGPICAPASLPTIRLWPCRHTSCPLALLPRILYDAR